MQSDRFGDLNPSAQSAIFGPVLALRRTHPSIDAVRAAGSDDPGDITNRFIDELLHRNPRLQETLALRQAAREHLRKYLADMRQFFGTTQ